MSEIKKPELGDNEVLIETKVISINPVDVKVRPVEEVINLLIGEMRPVILGWNIAGIVTGVGANVSDFVLSLGAYNRFSNAKKILYNTFK